MESLRGTLAPRSPGTPAPRALAWAMRLGAEGAVLSCLGCAWQVGQQAASTGHLVWARPLHMTLVNLHSNLPTAPLTREPPGSKRLE